MAPRRMQETGASPYVVNEPGEIADNVWNSIRSHVSELNAASAARLAEKLTKALRAEFEGLRGEPESTPSAASGPSPLGGLVDYRLTVHDVAQIVARRKKREESGNAPVVGEKCPALIVSEAGAGICNLQVFLDGEDSLWVKYRTRGERAGNWSERRLDAPT